MATALRQAGYATGAFVGADPLDSHYGLDRGFQVYDDRTTQGADESQFVLAERRGDEVVAAALAWWERRGKPRFAWCTSTIRTPLRWRGASWAARFTPEL